VHFAIRIFTKGNEGHEDKFHLLLGQHNINRDNIAFFLLYVAQGIDYARRATERADHQRASGWDESFLFVY